MDSSELSVSTDTFRGLEDASYFIWKSISLPPKGNHKIRCYVDHLKKYRFSCLRSWYMIQDVFECQNLMGCLHVRFCVLRLTSWSMCLTDECRGQTTANRKRISCFIGCHDFITYTRVTIATCTTARINGSSSWALINVKKLRFPLGESIACILKKKLWGISHKIH